MTKNLIKSDFDQKLKTKQIRFTEFHKMSLMPSEYPKMSQSLKMLPYGHQIFHISIKSLECPRMSFKCHRSHRSELDPNGKSEKVARSTQNAVSLLPNVVKCNQCNIKCH